MSKIEEQLAAEIRALRTRIEHLESLEYIAGADAVDSIHASATPTASKLLAMDANARFPSHDVTGDLGHTGDLIGKIGTLYKRYLKGPQYYSGLSSGVARDLLTFSGGANVNNSLYQAVMAGILTIGLSVSTTGGSATVQLARWHVLIAQVATQNMASVLEQVGTTLNKTWGTATTTLTVAGKAGATATSLTLEVTVTLTNMASCNLYATFEALSGATYAVNYITPSWAA